MAVRATVTAYETRGGVYNLIQGVVPVEDGFDGPLRLRDPLGNLVPTEQHVGVRGAGGVVRTLELRARAFSPLPGGAQTYTVEDGEELSGESFHAHQTFTLLCEAPNTQADPSVVTFTSRLLLSSTPQTGSVGDVTREIIRSGEMTSSSGSRLFGWRAHIMTVAGEPDVWLVKMSIQNGNVGTPAAPLGSSGILHDVFFNEIRLQMPSGYSMTHLHPTQYTTSTKLMGPDPSGKDHVLMQGGCKHYRFAIHTAATAARASVLLRELGFFVCDHSSTLWSWSNPATAWYGPHLNGVPDLDLSIHQPYKSSYSTIASGLLSGSPFDTGEGDSAWTKPLGPYHVHGPTDGGYTSGVFITPFRGYEVVNGSDAPSRIKAHMAILSMDADRMASKVAPNDTGVYICDSNQAPINCGDWDLTTLLYVSNPGRLNSNHQGPWPRLNANQWRLQYASQPGVNKVPGYYSQLGNYNLYDEAHPIRPQGACVPLIWLRNDPLAKDFEAQWSVWGRLHTLEYGPTTPAYSQSQVDGSSSLWGSYEVSSLNVQDYPARGARGGFGGRIGGWAIFAVCMDWLATDSDAKRDDTADWFATLKAHDELAQFQVGSKNWHALDNPGDTPVGNLIAQYQINGYVGQDPDAAAAQTIECGIRAGALTCVHSCTDDDDWLAMLADACDGLIEYHHYPGSDTFHFVVPTRSRTNIAAEPWSEPYVGPGAPGPGEAPDCFTVSPGTPGLDNFQVGTLVSAALKYSPSHSGALAVIYAFTGTSTLEDARDEIEAMFLLGGTTGENNRLKMEASWGPVLAFLQSFTDSPTAAPSPAVVQLVANSPTVSVPVQATPSPAVVSLVAVSPAAGSAVEATPGPAVMEMTVGGATRLGPAADPSPAVVQLVAVMPDVTAPVGQIATPGPAVVSLVAVQPDIYTSIGASPSPARVQLLAAVQLVGSPQIATPSPAVMGLYAIPPWDLEAAGISEMLVARHGLMAQLTAPQTVSDALTSTQAVTAQLSL